MSAPEGPFLYDDEPPSPYTGVARRRRGLLIAIGLATVAVAVLMVWLIPVVKGTAEEQATGAVGVLYAALADGDLDSAAQVLCADERERLAGADPGTDYDRGNAGPPEVTGVDDEGSAQLVTVRWDGGATAVLTVVNEGGPKVCGIGSDT